MNGRAVHDASIEEANVTAPAHSDAASAPHYVGSMSSACPHCAARFWVGESVSCCFGGSLIIEEPAIPDELSKVILSNAVLKNLRSYNMAMAMASVGHDKKGLPDGVFTLGGRFVVLYVDLLNLLLSAICMFVTFTFTHLGRTIQSVPCSRGMDKHLASRKFTWLILPLPPTGVLNYLETVWSVPF